VKEFIAKIMECKNSKSCLQDIIIVATTTAGSDSIIVITSSFHFCKQTNGNPLSDEVRVGGCGVFHLVPVL
jgi:hypothetical protein